MSVSRHALERHRRPRGILRRGGVSQPLAQRLRWAVPFPGRERSDFVFGPPRLICLFDPLNIPSRRVAERVGFTFDREVILDGERLPMHSLRAGSTPTR